MDKLKSIAKSVAKVMVRLPKKLVIGILIGLIVFILIVGSILVISLDDSKDNTKTNTNNASYAANQYSTNINIDLSTGEITSKYSVEELWKQMQETENRALEYVTKPEQFKKILNAELITKYPDTRQNPDAPIEWNSDEMNDIKSKKIQGIIKIKRKDENENEKTLSYVSPETFQSYIDEYNKSGSESAKNNALSHFTLEAVTVGSATGQAATITKGQSITIPSGLGDTFTYMGWQKITSTTSTQYKLREKAGMNFDSEGFGKINGRYVIACTTTYGNVGDYVDFYQSNGNVLPCVIGDIKNQNDSGCNQWGHLNGHCVVEFVVDKTTWYNKKNNPGTSTNHPEWGGQTVVKAVNGGSYFEDPNFGLDNINETSSTTTANDGKESDTQNELADSTKENSEIEVQTETVYCVKVATWYEQTTTVTSDDPDVEAKNSTSYVMTATNINYQEMVKNYQMPFEYLWSYLVLGKNYDLVSELADLVYNSKLEITVYDSLEVDTNKTVNTYKKKTKHERDKKDSNGNVVKDSNGNTVKEEYYSYDPHTTTTVVTTKTNTIDAEVTLADVWFEKYSRNYKKSESSNPEQTNTSTAANTDYIIDNTTTTTFNGTITTYTGDTPSIEEKINKKVDDKHGPSFVSIFSSEKYYDDRRNILEGAPEWLFEMLKQNEDTADMVDLTKYLINKVTGDYTEFAKYDLSKYNPGEFTSISTGGGTVSATGNRQQKLNQLFPNGIPKSSGQMQQYLKTISVPGINKSGKKITLRVTVHKSVANDVLAVCQEAQDSGFRIYSIGGYCWRVRNNGSANPKLSDHALGTAVDINASENKSTRLNWGIYSPGSNQYSMPESGVVVQGFKKRGWTWGGNWRSYHDYMHFSFTGE